jgi:deazaflavin-dependent oxidoreductase (nitroreductase family)
VAGAHEEASSVTADLLVDNGHRGADARSVRMQPGTLIGEDPVATESTKVRRREMAPAELEGALETASEIEITVTGRRSGRDISNPVWFVQHGEKLYLLPVGGAGSDWYRNALKTPTIRIAAGGAVASAQARPITDRETVNDIFQEFRAKYGADVQARRRRGGSARVSVHAVAPRSH